MILYRSRFTSCEAEITLYHERFETLTAVKIQVEVLYVVTPCSVDVLPEHYTASQPRRPRLEPFIIL